MSKIQTFKKALFVSAFLLTPLKAGEQPLEEFTPHKAIFYNNPERLEEQKSTGQRIGEKFYHKVKDSIIKDLENGRKAISYGQLYFTKGEGKLTSDIMQQILNVALSEYLGHGFRELANAAYGQLRPQILAGVLTRLQTKLADQLYSLTHKTRDYIEINGQKHFVVKGGSFFKLMAESIGLQHLPMGNALIAIMDTPVVKNFLQQKMNECFINIINGFLTYYNKPTLSQLMGEKTWETLKTAGFIIAVSSTALPVEAYKAAKSLTAEYDFINYNPRNLISEEETYGPLWNYLQPRLSYYIREMMFSSLINAEKCAANFIRTQALTPSLTRAWGAVTVGSGIAAHLLGVGGFVGTALSTTAGYLGYKGIQKIGDSALEVATEDLKKSTEYYLSQWLPISKNEHLLFGMNPNPSQVEKLLSAADYMEQEKLQSKTLVGEVIKQILITSGASSVIDSLSQSLSRVSQGTANLFNSLVNSLRANPNKTVEEAYEELGIPTDLTPSNIELLEKRGYRWYVYLKHLKKEHTSEEKEILRNIEKYPSWELRQEQLENLAHRINLPYGYSDQLKNYTQNMNEKRQQAQAKERDEKEIIQGIFQPIKLLFSQTGPCLRTLDILIKEAPFKRALKEAALNLSIMDQDILKNISKDWIIHNKEKVQQLYENYKDITQARKILLELINAYNADQDLARELKNAQEEISTLKSLPMFEGYSDAALLGLIKDKGEVLNKHGLLDHGFAQRLEKEGAVLKQASNYLDEQIFTNFAFQYEKSILQSYFRDLEALKEKIETSKEGYRAFDLKELKTIIMEMKQNNSSFNTYFDNVLQEFNPCEIDGFEQMIDGEVILNKFVPTLIFVDLYKDMKAKSTLSSVNPSSLRTKIYNQILADLQEIARGEDLSSMFAEKVENPEQIKEVYIYEDSSNSSASTREVKLAKARMVHDFNTTNGDRPFSLNDYANLNEKFFEAFKESYLQRYTFNPIRAELGL